MGAHLTLRYDRTADILYVDTCPPYAAQDSEEMDDEVVARRNPTTGAIESLEILWFSTRLLRSELVDLPVAAELRPAS